MHSAKQKVKDMASATKEHVDNYQAKVGETVEKTTARTKEEKQIAEERRKVKEAQAKANLHGDKAEHVAEKLDAKHHHHHHLYGQPPVAGGAPVVGGTTGTHQPLHGSTATNLHGTGHHHY